MNSRNKMPDIEKKAIHIMIEHPDVVLSTNVEEKWFSNNHLRELASFINYWFGRYTNADEIRAQFCETPFGKRMDCEALFAYLSKIPDPYDYPAVFKTLRADYYKRSLQSSAANIVKEPCEFTVNHLWGIYQEANQTDNNATFDKQQVTDELLRDLDEPVKSWIKTFPKFDRLLGGGLGSDQLLIVGARPSVGKTSFALNLALNAMLDNQNLTVELFSLEMSAKQNMRRLNSMVSQIPLNDWKNPAVRMNDQQKAKARSTIQTIAGLNFLCNDNITNIEQIAHVIQQHATRYGATNYLPIVDHIQLVESDDFKLDPRHALEKVSRRLKQLTQELHIPLIALSQLNRAVDSRQSKEPYLSDLRETGSIEQDANIVAFLWCDEDGSPVLNCSVKKNRDGELGTVKLYFERDTQRMVEVKNGDYQTA
ncbi:DnaB-like helicase C-terminal domain-containing protein [Lentilactobacillus hilgardii]|nr:DnaB-like helicase C-terminal domain-containing protein [Lentilactobacillus hilgardii]